MKKFILPLSLLLCLTLSLTLIGCADKGNKTNNTKTSYNIQVSQDDEIYTVTDLPATAYEGDTVTFKVNLTHPTDSVLNSVTLSGNTTKETKLSPNSENVYSFTMPGEPVRIKIDANYYPTNKTDNFLSWDTENQASFEIWQPSFNGDEYFSSDNFVLGSMITSQPKGSPANFALSVHTEQAFSLNESVIPKDAIKVTFSHKDGNQANQFFVNIDRSKVKAGSTKIVLIVENGHKFNDQAVLACDITVTEPEPLEKVELWTETVTIDLSAIESDQNTERLALIFEDLDYKENMFIRQTQMFDISDLEIKNGKVTFIIEYAAHHSYSIDFHYYMSTQPEYPSVRFDKISDGGNYNSEKLTFSKNNGSIELIIE